MNNQSCRPSAEAAQRAAEFVPQLAQALPLGPVAAVSISAAAPLVQKLVNVITANCDGVLAESSFKFKGVEVHAVHPLPSTYYGYDSNAGCGENSHYEVSMRFIWSFLGDMRAIFQLRSNVQSDSPM